MAERTTPLRSVKDSGQDALNRIRGEVDQLIGQIDFQDMGRKVKDFGRENPVGLALAALTIGVAAGFLMKKSLPPTDTIET